MHVAFEQLISGFCALTGYTSPQQIIDGGGITIENVTFTLLRKPAVDPQALFLHADFGQFDLVEQAVLYPLILQENMLMLSSRECTFSVSATQDRIVLIEKISLSTHTPATLLALVRSLARKVNYFSKPHRGGNVGLQRRFSGKEDRSAQGQPSSQSPTLRRQ